MSESASREVTSRDISKIILPSDAYAFYFYDANVLLDDDEELLGHEKNKSGMYYPNPVHMPTKEQVMNMDGAYGLQQYMESGTQVIQTRLGNWQPLEKNDIICTVKISEKAMLYT